jgi:hypothetical protein
MEWLNKIIYDRAIEAEICEPWAIKIANAPTVHHMLEMYRKGIDFCLKNDFPSNSLLLQLAGDQINEHGIFIDAPVDLVDPEFTTLLGKCNAAIAYTDYSVSTLFVKHTSTGSVIAGDNAIVVIDCFDNSTLLVTASDHSNVLINVYGNAQAKHSSIGKAKINIIHKNKPTY